MEWLKENRCDFSHDLKVAWLAHDRTSWRRLFQREGEETEKALEAKSDLTNGMTSKAPVEDLNVLTGSYGIVRIIKRAISLIRKSQMAHIQMAFCKQVNKQEVKVIWQKAPHGGPIARLGVTPGVEICTIEFLG